MTSLLLIPLVLAVLFGLAWIKKVTGARWMNALFWISAWWIGLNVIVRYSITPPIPTSIVQMFVAIITISLLCYVSSDSRLQRETTLPLIKFAVSRKYTLPLVIVAIIIPLIVAGKVYLGTRKTIQAPVFGRSIHPAPPSNFNFGGKKINLTTLDNPYRSLETEDREAFLRHVENGRRVYYQNCVYCHGDTLEGNGIYSHGFNPIPANLADSGTIAQLQEGYMFWRIAKGGPGLPEESGPWSSAMPAWEKFLDEEELWDVILFLYEFTGLRPRAREEHH